MNIVAADPHARVLSEAEVLTLLGEPIPMRIGMLDHGWPLVHPVWHVFEDGVFRLVVGKTSHKAKVLRAEPRAYFTVDTGAGGGNVRGARGRATVRIVDDDVERAVDVCRKELRKYTGSETGPLAEELLKWARGGDMSVVELTPLRFATFAY